MNRENVTLIGRIGILKDKSNEKRQTADFQSVLFESMIKDRVAYSANLAASSFSDVTKFRNTGLSMVWSQMN